MEASLTKAHFNNQLYRTHLSGAIASQATRLGTTRLPPPNCGLLQIRRFLD